MGWDKCHLWDLSSEGSGRTRFTKLVHIRIWNTKITVKIYLRSNISPSYRFRSHRSICLLVTVISLEKMLPRHKTMFVVVSASVWGKNSLNNWCRYRVQLVLPFFFVLLLPCVTHSSCSLPACLCLLEKRRKLRLFCGARVFFRVFFFTPLERGSHFTVASRLPPFDRKTLKNCACPTYPGLLNETDACFLSLHEGVPFFH